MLIDCIKREDGRFPNPGPNTKITWILIVVLTSYIGATIYYFSVKRKIPDPVLPGTGSPSQSGS